MRPSQICIIFFMSASKLSITKFLTLWIPDKLQLKANSDSRFENLTCVIKVAFLSVHTAPWPCTGASCLAAHAEQNQHVFQNLHPLSIKKELFMYMFLKKKVFIIDRMEYFIIAMPIRRATLDKVYARCGQAVALWSQVPSSRLVRVQANLSGLI